MKQKDELGISLLLRTSLSFVIKVFLMRELWINFSSPEAENENWEQLVRLPEGRKWDEMPVSSTSLCSA